MSAFYDMYGHYFVEDKPPVITDRVNGEIVRHGGSQGRSAFWAGYDGLVGGIYNRPNRKTAVGSAYAAGKAYRKAVDAGRRPALPEPVAGQTQTGSSSFFTGR